MAFRSLLLPPFFLVLFAVPLTYGIPWGNLIYGWPPVIDVHAPKIQALARFAISKHNDDAGESLVYVEVVSAGSRPRRFETGRDYKLVIYAADGEDDDRHTYEAIVWADGDSMKLMSFRLKS